jgi:adenine-specific DNA-methyltransferase
MNKTDLIQKIKQLEGISQDERSYLINLVNTKKKYGLVWEDKPEDVEEQLRTQLPVLREVVEKRILAKDLPQAEKQPETKQATLFDNNNPDNTNNNDNQSEAPNHILIEGDNLHALTALTFTHEGTIDVMYFDPPYNTGNKDFKYNDSYVDKEDTYRHSKWLSFMDKRLRIAKRLLSDKGVIFISIDDNEQAQLKLLCGEVFGEENLIAEFIWRTDGNFDNQAQIKNCHEYIMSYAKNSSTFKVSAIIDPNVNEDSKLYKDNIQNTIVKNGPKNPMSEVYLPAGFPTLFENGRIISRTNKFPHYSEDVTVESYKTTIGTIVKSGWSSKTLLELYIKNDYTPVIDSKNQLTEFKISETGSIEAIKVRADQSHVISVLMNMGNTQNNSNRLLEMGIKFSYPKPQTLLQYLVGIIPNKKIIILDIFAGSGTTLHATMQLNDDDGGSRQCILATNNENNICEEVTYERNRLAIQGYTNSKGQLVSGLTNNNLRYYKSEFVGREPSLKNKRELTRLATELLCIKEDCYAEQTLDFVFTNKSDSKNIRFFEENDKRMLVVYDDSAIETSVEIIKSIISNNQVPNDGINVYVFSPGQYPFTEEFEEVLPFITLCALPDAIYKAFLNVLPKKKRQSIPELEEDAIESQPELFD